MSSYGWEESQLQGTTYLIREGISYLMPCLTDILTKISNIGFLLFRPNPIL